MIEIVQAGQVGKTKSLIDMHRVRKLIFKDRMEWDVDISQEGLEIDNYDLPETVYILVKNDDDKVVGVWRMLPTTSPSMIRDIWPKFLNNFSMPINDHSWEVSRFGIHSYLEDKREHIKQVNQVTARLISGLIEVCMMTGISHIYTLYNPQVGRAVKKIGFIPERVSEESLVDGKPTIVGCFKMDQEALDRVRTKAGVFETIQESDLPPILAQRLEAIKGPAQKEVSYA